MIQLKNNIETALARIVDKIPCPGFSDSIQTKFTEAFFKQLIKPFGEDYLRYYPGCKIDMKSIFFNIPLTGILLYRISRNFHIRKKNEQAMLYSNLVRMISQMEIYYTAEIGAGLKINHGFGIVIGSNCKIGRNALLYQQITIGDSNPLSVQKRCRPCVGDNLTMYSGAKILGPIQIGNNVIISQNTVCFQNIEDNQILMGNGAMKQNDTKTKIDV